MSEIQSIKLITISYEIHI